MNEIQPRADDFILLPNIVPGRSKDLSGIAYLRTVMMDRLCVFGDATVDSVSVTRWIELRQLIWALPGRPLEEESGYEVV